MTKLVNKMDIYKKFDELIKSSNNVVVNKKVIGVLSEKYLHKTIKNLYEENKDNQEIRIDKYFVDILRDNEIIEVQTKQFNKLREKIAYLLSLDKYSINIVYPVFNSKMIYMVDENNNISNPKKSPKKFKYPEVFYELYKIKSFLDNKNLKITLLIFDIDEYRMITNNRKGYYCFERIPTKLIEEVILEKKEDYLKLFPKNLNEPFTINDLCKQTKSNNKYVSKMVNVMKFLDIIELVGKQGRKYLYKVKKVEF